VVVFAGHKEYRGRVPERMKGLCGYSHLTVVGGRDMVDLDTWIGAGFVYRGIEREDKDRYILVE